MPTTIYDSSLLTQRRRDKVIAQQVRNANITGNMIIIPQAGYGSYTLGEQSNGAITYFRKDEGCITENVSCNCISQTNVSFNSPIYTIQIVINPGDSLTVGIGIRGSGTIYWGDETSEAFDTMGEDGGAEHTYTGTGTYYIVIATYITGLVTYTFRNLSQQSIWQGYNGPNWPNVVSITLENPEGLTLLFLNNPTLQIINGLKNCRNVTELQLSNNSSSINGIESLVNLRDLYLENKPNLIGELDLIFLKNTLSTLSISDSPVNSIKNISEFTRMFIFDISNTNILGSFDVSGLTDLSYFYCNNIDINNLSIFPTNLNDFEISNTLIAGTFDISLCVELLFFKCNNTSINNLGTLPSSLRNLNISNTSISNLGTLPSSLRNLNISNTSISNLGTLPSSLINLNISNTSITGTFDISSLDELIQFSSIGNAISSFGPFMPVELDTINMSECNLSEIEANDIGTSLVSNGKLSGSIILIDQNPPISLSESIPPWSTLSSLGWHLFL